jgi:hypothetical protein
MSLAMNGFRRLMMDELSNLFFFHLRTSSPAKRIALDTLFPSNNNDDFLKHPQRKDEIHAEKMMMHLQMDNRQPRQRVGSIAMRKRRVNMMTGIAFVAAVCFSSQLTMAFRLTEHTATRINVYDKRRNLVSVLASIRESVSTSSATSKLSEESHNHHHHQQQHQQHDHHISQHIHAFEPRTPIMKKIDVEIDSHHQNLQHHPHHQDLHQQVHDHHAEPFKITISSLTTTTKPTKEKHASSAATTTPIQEPPSHILAIDEMNPIFQFKSKRTGNPKIINAHGLHHLVIILLTMPLWMIALEAVHALGTNIPGFDEYRGKFDRVGKIWCRIYLRLTNCYPIIDGDVGRLILDESNKNNKNSRSSNNPCLFVANHASFLDIAVLCCVLNPTFKFIAKDSLKNFPGVGRQLVGVSRGISFFVSFSLDVLSFIPYYLFISGRTPPY